MLWIKINRFYCVRGSLWKRTANRFIISAIMFPLSLSLFCSFARCDDCRYQFALLFIIRYFRALSHRSLELFHSWLCWSTPPRSRRAPGASLSPEECPSTLFAVRSLLQKHLFSFTWNFLLFHAQTIDEGWKFSLVSKTKRCWSADYSRLNGRRLRLSLNKAFIDYFFS